MKYIVEIIEILQKQIKVNADSEEKAREIVAEAYFSGEEVLTAEDFKEVSFEIIKEE